MIICAIDTSGRDGSIALARASNDSFEVLSFAPIAGGTYSAQLVPQLSEALQQNHLAKDAVDLYVVCAGPGSFTGLRVGISTVKALADAFQKPVVSVSVLEAIAFQVGKPGTVLTALDAQRQEVFVGEYEIAAETTGAYPVSRQDETLSPVAQFVSSLQAVADKPLVYSPDVTIERKLREANLPVELVSRPASDVYARIGALKFGAGLVTPPEVLDANYIRRSDAEILSASKLGIALK